MTNIIHRIPGRVLFNLFSIVRRRNNATYLLITWLCTAYILSGYASIMQPLLPAGNIFREYMVCGGQILFQGVIISLIHKQKAFSYLCTMMTVSLGGALLLLPLYCISLLIHIPAIIGILYFLAVAGLMLLEHIRRIHVLKLTRILSATWVFYRFIVLFIIYKA